MSKFSCSVSAIECFEIVIGDDGKPTRSNFKVWVNCWGYGSEARYPVGAVVYYHINPYATLHGYPDPGCVFKRLVEFWQHFPDTYDREDRCFVQSPSRRDWKWNEVPNHARNSWRCDEEAHPMYVPPPPPPPTMEELEREFRHNSGYWNRRRYLDYIESGKKEFYEWLKNRE